METNRWNIHDLTQMALLVALLSASAYLAFPIPITLVTVTAQTLVLNLIALLLDRRKAALTVAVWILLGAVGIPVYSGGRGGLSELVGPTGGFIFAVLVAAYLISLLKGKEFSLPRYLLVTLCIGIPVIDLAGAAWYKFYADIGWGTALLTTALPFLPGDIIKSVAATLLAKPIAIALSKLRRPSAA